MKRILQIAAIALLTAFFLWLFLRNANLAGVWDHLRKTNLAWVFGGFAVNFTALLLRTARWRTILDPDDPPPFYATFFANGVGYMLSTVLPIRAADVARPALLSRRTSHRFSGALGTVLIERIFDLSAVLLLFVLFAVLRWNEFSHDVRLAGWFYIVRLGAIAAGAILSALFLFLLGLHFFRQGVRRFHTWTGGFLPHRFRDSWMHFFDTFVASLSLIRDRTLLLKLLSYTAGIWLCLTSQFWFATNAMHQPLPFDASFFVLGVTTVGLAIPTPGGVGGFHKATQLVLTHFYRFSIDASVAVAVVFHIVGTLPIVITGLVLFAREGLHWKDVTPA
ncbi:MAG: lysylphosphatidylglycerol synthase transmembrane domain-containing protein [Thermoanaerobaculia bacterium]